MGTSKMKIMADSDNYFSIGMIVSCTTCHGQNIEGEVVAFDYSSKMLAIKSTSSSGKPGTADVRMLNMNYVSDVSVVKEASEPPQTLASLNMPKLMSRVRTSVDEKRRQVNYIGIGVTPEAQKLFNTITKTISEVRWDKQNIIIMNEVTITPPYTVEDCRGKDGSSKALQHVKKIVDKYIRETESRESSVSSTSS